MNPLACASRAPACEEPGRKALKRLRAELFDLQHGRCAYCDEPMTRVQGPRLCTLDHVIPIQAGGTWHRANLVAACHQCNRLKGCMTIDQIRRLLSRMERLAAIACNTHDMERPPVPNTPRAAVSGADAGTGAIYAAPPIRSTGAMQ